MKPGTKIDRLRELGYRVLVTRRRPLNRYPWQLGLDGEEGRLFTRFELEELRAKSPSAAGQAAWAAVLGFAPAGGITAVQVQAPDGTAGATGEAKCSELDNFNKKIGLEIALNRALKGLGVEL